MKVLVIEDDIRLSQHLETSFREQGFFPVSIHKYSELLDMIHSPLKFDMVVMDRLLDGHDSKDLLVDLKTKWPLVPVLVLSAISTPNERMETINLGADDYLGKPFSTGELIARVKALKRRSPSPVVNYLQVGSMVIDLIKRVITVGDKSEPLPAREFSVLRTLSQDLGRIWSKEELLDYVWGQSTEIETNVVESTIANLRKKLADLNSGITIKNLRNSGYWIEK